MPDTGLIARDRRNARDPRKVRVMIVDDSPSVRMGLAAIFEADPRLEVIAMASDPYVAAQRMAKELPDVLFLDIEMPRMDGLTFLQKIMAQRPIPTVICSTIATEGSDVFLKALDLGAVEVVAKPVQNSAMALREQGKALCDIACTAARVQLRGRRQPPITLDVPPKLNADSVLAPRPPRAVPKTVPVVAIGASTGGTDAIGQVLRGLRDCPGIVIVQHMPEHFTAAFARRLDMECDIAVKEAEDGDAVLPGRALIAPGGHHMALVRVGQNYKVRVFDGPLVSRHRPSVDVLFRSVAQQAGGNALGMLLTGMGDDGATGLLEMREAGARTIAQDEASCVVFGMPKEAIELGAAQKIAPLGRMAAEITGFGNRPAKSG
ncbi:protein-glutamate methylesterase/protein-glutamine glutaminase [Sphingomonas sp. RS6]